LSARLHRLAVTLSRRQHAGVETVAFERFREAFLAGDAGQVAAAFTPDAAYATNAGVLLRGREQISAGSAAWFRLRPPGAVVELQVELLRAGSRDDLRWELIEYRQHGYLPDRPDAGGIDEAGYAMAIYRREPDGAWLIESLVVNKRA
jgi:uncharacterized protein (TIGR02246 family)